LVATAIHGGHDLRPRVAGLIGLAEPQRLLEEDPYTGDWAAVGDSSIVVHRSRFEVDLNRSRRDAVYLEPGDAWGLEVWKKRPPQPVIEESRRIHDRFYDTLYGILARAERAWGAFAVLDLHSYNHRRDGPGAPPADPAVNPDVNLGTASVDRRRWGRLIDRLARDLRSHEIGGVPLDVRENMRFEGAHLVRWVNATFPATGCAIAVEVKKIYMDEHTGEVDVAAHKEIQRALEAGAAGVRQELRR
jgi:N-formylglutamate amidohydrolase